MTAHVANGWFFALLAALASVGFGPASGLAQAPPVGHPQLPPGEAPAVRQVAEAIDYESIQDLGQAVTLAQLNNGLTVIVRENHAAPVATVRAYVRNTGGAYEGELLGTGVSHVLEHLVALGSTSKRTEREIELLVDSMGGRTNAYTADNITAYYITCPADRAPLAIELVADGLQYAIFDPDEYRREMGVVERELEMGRTERPRMLYQAMKELVYTEHPMRFPTIGYLSVLQQLTRDQIVDFYRQRYVPQNVVFVVVGAVDANEVLAEVLVNFRDFRRTPGGPVVLPEEPPQATPRSRRMEMPGSTTHVSVAWPTVRLQHSDLYPLDVASALLTNGDSSRLVRRLRIEEPLAISVNSFSYTPGDVPGWFQITVECPPENVDRCRRVILQEIARLTQELVEPAELDKIKRQTAAEHVFGQQTVEAQAESLAHSFIATGNPLFDDEYLRQIERVTPEQVRAAARRYFLPQRQNTVFIEPLGALSEELEREEPEPVESPVVHRQLPNGLQLLVKRHSVLPMVSIQAFVKAGVLTESAENAGRGALASELMTRGTERFTADEIAEYFDSIGGSVSVDSQRNTSFLQCQVLSDDFEASLKYVYDILFKPTFPQDEFERAQQLHLGRIAARQANPQAMMLDFWVQLLPPDSPYRNPPHGTTESVSRLTVDDCRQFHGDYFVPNNMVLAVFGDVDPDQTIARLEQLFGGVPPASDFQFPAFPEQPESRSPASHQLDAQLPGSALLLAGYSVPNILDTRTQAALEVLGGVLTGGTGTGGRLFNELRGEQLVYYVFGFQINGLAPGHYLFMAQTRPETVDEVLERIQQNLERIAEQGVEDDELGLVVDKLVAAHAISNTTPSSQAFQAALDQLYGLGHDYREGYDERVRAVTSEELRDVVRRYFRDPVVATVQ